MTDANPKPTAARPGPRLGVGWILDPVYIFLLVVVGPFWALYRRLRGKRTAPLPRRLGAVEPVPGDRPVLWLHAVSVGEVLCARGLVQRLVAEHPHRQIVVTATTATGLETARRTLEGVLVREAPLDLSFAFGTFLRRVRPAALILVELELWPNWMRQARRRGLPVWVVNAKVSERSARGYARLESWGLPMLSGLQRVLAQEDAYAARFRDAGMAPERVVVTGNLKYANLELRDGSLDRAALREEHGFAADAPILVAGSTHPGEEEILLGAFASIWAEWPQARLVLVPRHPERSQDVGALCRRAERSVGWRGHPKRCSNPEVLVVDTLGELARLYALGDVAFVGGTIVPIGGHNLLEPAGLGLPVVTGPELATVREMADRLRAVGCLTIVAEAAQLATQFAELFRDEDARRRAGEGVRGVLDQHRDALDRTMNALAPLLEPSTLPRESAPHG